MTITENAKPPSDKTNIDLNFKIKVEPVEEDGKQNKQLKLIGLDLLSIGNLPNISGERVQFSDEDSQWYDWIGTDNEVWVGRSLAEDLGLEEKSVISFMARIFILFVIVVF